jgi:hypothetical protein
MTGWTRFTGGLQGGGVLSHRGTKPQREIPISHFAIYNPKFGQNEQNRVTTRKTAEGKPKG